MKLSDKQVKIAVIVALLVIIGLMSSYPYLTSNKSTITQQPIQTNQTIITNSTSSLASNTTTVPVSSNYNLSFYVKILKDIKIGKIYYKGIPPFYSIILHGNISGDRVSYLDATYHYRILSLGEVPSNPSISVGNLVFNYYEPEKTPKGCSSYGFKVSNSSGEYYGDILVSFCPYLYTSSSQIYIAGNATPNGLAGVLFFNWKQDKVFVLIEREPLKQPPVIGDWFLQITYDKKYSTQKPITVKVLLVNAKPDSLVDVYYNKDNRLTGIAISFPNGTQITQLKPGKIYIRRKLVYLDPVYDYTWYPTLVGVRTAYFPPGEYLLNINYSISVKNNNRLENTVLTYKDKIDVLQSQVQMKTIAGILAIGENQVTIAWTRNDTQNTLNMTVTGSSEGQVTIWLQAILANGTVKTIEKQLAVNKPTTIVLNGDIDSIKVQGTLPGGQSFRLTLPLKR